MSVQGLLEQLLRSASGAAQNVGRSGDIGKYAAGGPWAALWACCWAASAAAATAARR